MVYVVSRTCACLFVYRGNTTSIIRTRTSINEDEDVTPEEIDSHIPLDPVSDRVQPHEAQHIHNRVTAADGEGHHGGVQAALFVGKSDAATSHIIAAISSILIGATKQ